MRVRFHQDAIRRTSINEPVKHLACERVLDVGSQLSVGKRPRASFSELNVRRRIQHTRFLERGNVLGSAIDVEPALDHDRPQAATRQIQRREKPRRAQAHDHDRCIRSFFAGRIFEWLIGLNPLGVQAFRTLIEQFFFEFTIQVACERRSKVHVRLFSRVDALL